MTTPVYVYNVGPGINLGKREERKEQLRRRRRARLYLRSALVSNEAKMKKERNDYAERGV